MAPRDPIIPPQMPLRLAPEVLDPVDVAAATVSERRTMIDPVVLEPRHVECVVNGEAVGVDHRVGLDPLADDRQEGSALEVRGHGGVDPPAALEDAEDDDLPGRTAPSFALAMPSEVALIDLDFAVKGALVSDALGDGLAEFVVVEGRRVLVDADECGGGPCRGPGDEVFDEPSLSRVWKPASSSGHDGD